ncbi:ATP-binding protein [Ktedonosporobacter rubrisoli]|uniref:ATP-binding protein n=1 Tax=Ktedonosporobacter rubrisoli TaxID=2509675 RepID=A0A4P6K321_KTERU|nr:ATP-binding protein [Ktedonosporobacter rubrisoli]QBD82559.1 ATP-binding protein [Ktedonosporobacter rubrisoli]
MNAQRTEILTKEISKHFKNTSVGHCARVDFLPREEARAICQQFHQVQAGNGIKAFLLQGGQTNADDELSIAADHAIELRNRKEESICLFVPMDIVDATASSLGNSFALIDGRTLYDSLLKQLRARLSNQAQRIVQGVFNQLRGILKVSKEQQISFVSALLERDEQHQLEQAGLELWRVGLIADGQSVLGENEAAFMEALDNNKRCVRALVYPGRLQASLPERIQALLVDEQTGQQLIAFFRGRNLNDPRSWSQALIQAGLTFERWRFPEEDHSDIKEVQIQHFLDSANKVERYTHLLQPNGPGTDLLIPCGPKSSVVVRWKVEPPNPRNLKYWRVELLPLSVLEGDTDQDSGIDLPSREIPASRRNLTIKLDFELERQLGVFVRVTPIEVSGQPVSYQEDQGGSEKIIYADSDEFFLMPESEFDEEDKGKELPRETRSEVSTIALGRLEQALQTRATSLEESGAQWSSGELEYFSLRLDNKRAITLGLSSVLKELEDRTLRGSRGGGMFQLLVDEVKRVSADACKDRYMLYGDDDSWRSFWNAREALFRSIRQSDPRHFIEVVQWKPEITSAAVRYVQSYQALLQALLQKVSRDGERQAERWAEMREAMSLDTLLIRVRDGAQKIEEALVILPTHPLRIAWLVGYTQLLSNWEEQLLERTKPATRKGALDLEALRMLSPINTPAFAFHSDSPEQFVFFQNLRFYHGVLLPVGVPDPHRRYSELATILGADQDQITIGTIQPEQLANHLAKFIELHPYIQTLVTTLINPDRGDFFAEALKQLALPKNEEEEGSEESRISAFQVTSYVEDERKSSVQALNRVRQTLERFGNSGGSYFLPGLSATLRTIEQLEHDDLADAHVAVVSDITRPTLTAYGATEGEIEARSFALYGLLCRFVPQLKRDASGLIWRYQILTERLKPAETHPVKTQYSDILIQLHTTLLEAGARLLGGEPGSQPALQVHLDEPRRRLLERLHQSANWVITLDRFFALDYYDSPHIESLNEVARKYVLDYSPEFSEGLGHRLMITTSWHEEIGSLLRQAMEERGISAIESSVSHLLHHLKLVSGSLALQALESRTSASGAVGLGIVTAWLQGKNRLRQSVLVPVDLHPRLFAREGKQSTQAGDRRCDLALFTLKRNIVDVTFIEVKWRRGRVSIDRLGEEMQLQMQASRRALEDHFFNAERIDGALQRSHLANVLRFYFERSRRYGLFDPEQEHTFLERLSELEKAGLDFRYRYEGYIVSLDERATATTINGAKIRVLTAADFDTQRFPIIASSSLFQESTLPETDMALDEENGTDMGIADESDDDLLRNEVMRRRTAVLEPLDAVAEPMTVARDSDLSQPFQYAVQDGEPHAVGQEVAIGLGKALQGGECHWQPSVKGSPHLFIIGIPGQGKSWTITRLLIELSKQHVPSLVLDFHGQFSDPAEPFTQQVRPHVLDVARGLPFSPFECSSHGEDADIIANSLEVAEIFAHVTGLGPIQQDTLYQALLSAYQEQGFGKANGSQQLAYPTLENVLEQIKRQGSNRNADIILARCRSLLEMNLFRPEQSEVNLLTHIRNGLVLDLHRVLERLQLAAGAFILRKVYKDMFRWGPTEQLRLAIVLDEAHRLARDVTLPKIMKEGRKFGVVVIVASQELTDFHQGIIGNIGTKVIFRVNHPDSRKVAGLLQAPLGVDLGRQIAQMQVGTAYVQTPDMPQASRVQMHPLR